MSPSRRAVARASIFAVVLALASVPLACGDSGDDGGDASSPAADTAPADETARTEADGDASGDGSTPADDAPGSDSGDAPAGDDASGDDADAGDADDGEDDAPSADPADEEAEVTRVVRGMYRDFSTGNAAGVCGALAKRARAEVVKSIPGSGSCQEAFGRVLAINRDGFANAADVRVGAVEIDGSVALVKITLSGRSGKIRLAREDGEWRFGTPGVIPGGQPQQ